MLPIGHHKNPVGREWRWKVDPPDLIVDEAISRHVAMVKEFRGAPGVQSARWEAALTPRHCALSLVGEPIMYPHVNELVKLLHDRGLSSFLVTNAQFPDAIAALGPVTQLYVSVDAATRDALKAVDRPLFADFWERFVACLQALRAKRARTVYRLTLVKGEGGNMAPGAAHDSAKLVALGAPEFIEVKGVTWSGVSDGSTLTMANVPWHYEVRAFCEELTAAVAERKKEAGLTAVGGGAGGAGGGDVVPTYALAAEHAHSCCVLSAQEKYRIEGIWHTHINYERFHELVQRFYSTGEVFGPEDFTAPTPDWAAWGSNEAGFAPSDVRWRRGDNKKLA